MLEPTPSLNKNGGELPVEAFRTIVKRDLIACEWDSDQGNSSRVKEPGLELLSQRSGMPLKSLQRVISGETKRIHLDKVDAYCCEMGRHIRDVYPHLYSDEQLAADVAHREYLDSPAGRRRTEENRKSGLRANALRAKKRRLRREAICGS